MYLRHKQESLILSRLSDFMTCSTCFNIQSEGSMYQLLYTVGRGILLDNNIQVVLISSRLNDLTNC